MGGVSGQASSGHGSWSAFEASLRCRRLASAASSSANIVVEDVFVLALLVADVRPPVCEELPGRGDHPSDEDEQVDGDANADERCRKAAERAAA